MAQQSGFFTFSRAKALSVTLLCVELLDELIVGLIAVALPLLRDQVMLTYAQIGLLFTLSELASVLCDPVISLLSDRGSKRWWIIGGLVGMSFSFVLIGGVHSFVLLLLAFMLTAPCGKASVGLSQAALIDQAAMSNTRTMTRWVLMGNIGDFLSPLTVTLAVILGAGWSGLCWLAAALWFAAALTALPQRFPHPRAIVSDDESESMGLLVGLRMALCDPVLLRWAALATIPTMMDEVFLSFVSLYLHDVLHASQALIGVIIAIDMAGSLVGLLIVGQIVKRGNVHPQRLLIALAVVALIGVAGFLTIHLLWIAALMLFITSLGVTGWYPIAKAAAYDRLPGRSGTVLAVISLGGPFEIALPGIIGFVAARFGLLAGLGLLGLAPLLMLLLAPKHDHR
jgi:MFS family permease